MTYTDFLLPVFVEVFLIFALLIFMAKARADSISRHEATLDDIALDGGKYGPKARQCGNCFSNQFELPTLFFVLIAFILITRVGNLLLLVLAWIFVLSRVGHAYIHTTSNDVIWRMRVYSVGAVVLFIMWLIFALRILLAF
ncbi:MAG: MAPEG family protein [Hyphomicrobium sp.]